MKTKPTNNIVWKVSQDTTLLPFISESLVDQNKTKVKQTLKYGSILVNGKVTTKHSHPLKKGDQVECISVKAAHHKQLEARLLFPIIFEDNDLIVVEKPHGLLTMGTDKEREKTLYFHLTAYERAKSDRGKGRVFIVHRLDRETSGLVVFAKSEAIKNALQKNWAQATKKYHAVTEGVPEEKQGTINTHLREDKSKRVHSSKDHASGDSRPATTHYCVIKSNATNALLEIMLKTGRKNQIRVHLSDLGHPIIGDNKYGAETNALQRLALHASFLSLPHPTTDKMLTLRSTYPKGFNTMTRSTPKTKK
ncbi:MAG: 23S rRNA pseudouridine1911/1915/1917 synthase [Candidatus Omnitrophota bacterium]|jgi:23S rRNA pseudouridine1911/1915/1917 synthase